MMRRWPIAPDNSSMPRQRRTVSEEEARLFRHAMRGVSTKSGEPVEPFSGPRAEGQTPPPRRAPAPLPNPKRTQQLPRLEAGQTAGIDRRTADRFTKGRMPVEAALDLHGMGQDQAHRALIAFVHRARSQGLRSVLVITGKGRRSADDGFGRKGTLKAATPGWLNEPGVREHVLSFSAARPKDGGDGALYILLKRTRGHG